MVESRNGHLKTCGTQGVRHAEWALGMNLSLASDVLVIGTTMRYIVYSQHSLSTRPLQVPSPSSCPVMCLLPPLHIAPAASFPACIAVLTKTVMHAAGAGQADRTCSRIGAQVGGA